MKGKITISEQVADILRGSDIDGCTLRLTAQLSREMYVEVNKIIVALGGKWARGQKAHVFPNPVKDVLSQALDTGSVVDHKKALDQFFSPQCVVNAVMELADIGQGETILEPSAGAGALAMAARDAGGVVTCCEIDPQLATGLQQSGFEVWQQDFLTTDATRHFDAVVMNPPFSVANGAGLSHITHALTFLRSGGRLVSVMPAGINFREDKKTQDFKTMLDSQSNWNITDLEAGSFTESGTAVNTCVLWAEVRG